MLNYTPHDWYWRSEDGRIFSSDRGRLVDSEDVGWALAEDIGRWTSWPTSSSGEQTQEALQEVLAPYGIYIGLEELKAALTAKIDADAEIHRLKFITGGSGQALTYAQKADEANAYISATDPNEDDYPLLLAEVGVTAGSIGGVASVVRSAYGQWQQIGAAIEAIRLSSKQAIAQSDSDAEAWSVYGSITWPGGQV